MALDRDLPKHALAEAEADKIDIIWIWQNIWFVHKSIGLDKQRFCKFCVWGPFQYPIT